MWSLTPKKTTATRRMTDESMSFWEHLDALRSAIVRSVVVSLSFTVVAFVFKNSLFDVVLAPRNADFITYRLLGQLSAFFGGELEPFSVKLINTGLAQQFVAHLQMALCMGVVCASPYVVYQFFHFVSPALYDNERHYARLILPCAYVLFFVGVLSSYFLLFPLTFRFLGTYQVSVEVENLISLESYISTLLVMSLTMGVVFELPIVCWLLAKFGLLNSSLMKQYRKHAFVAILIVAAVITPTADAFTLFAVALPVYLLYEVSLKVVKRTRI